MRTKLILIVIVVLVILVVSFMYWSAQIARKKSQDILVEFQRIDRSIDSSDRILRQEIDSLYKIDSASQISH